MVTEESGVLKESLLYWMDKEFYCCSIMEIESINAVFVENNKYR